MTQAASTEQQKVAEPEPPHERLLGAQPSREILGRAPRLDLRKCVDVKNSRKRDAYQSHCVLDRCRFSWVTTEMLAVGGW